MAQFNESFLEDGTCVLALGGEVDLAEVDELLEVARDGLNRASALSLDLCEVSFIDSSGLGALVLIRNEAKAAGKPLRLLNIPRAVSRLLALTGLEDAFGDSSDRA